MTKTPPPAWAVLSAIVAAVMTRVPPRLKTAPPRPLPDGARKARAQRHPAGAADRQVGRQCAVGDRHRAAVVEDGAAQAGSAAASPAAAVGAAPAAGTAP